MARPPNSKKITWMGALLAVGLMASGCGDSSNETDKTKEPQLSPPAESKAGAELATKAKFTHCVKVAGVAFEPSGAVPGDTARKKHPRGFDPPAEGHSQRHNTSGRRASRGAALQMYGLSRPPHEPRMSRHPSKTLRSTTPKRRTGISRAFGTFCSPSTPTRLLNLATHQQAIRSMSADWLVLVTPSSDS